MSEVSVRIMIGASDGLAFAGRAAWHSARQQACAALIAACTSRAAPVNIPVEAELQNDARAAERAAGGHRTPAIRPSERSSGVATDEAMVSGDAPGSDALTMITGKSTAAGGHWQQAEAQHAAQRNGERD